MSKLIAGNWKMNGVSSSFETLQAIIDGLADAGPSKDVEALICPPFTLVYSFAARSKASALKIGAQTCHTEKSGAHTGDISAEMLADAGATHVITGHSERRADHGEANEIVSAQTESALESGLTPIICVGETLSDREAGQTMDVVLKQLHASIPDAAKGQDFVVAYEPVWAIGTGLTASPEEIGEVHLAIREALKARFGEQGKEVKILYGGSMKPANAGEILAITNVDGGLIGGASLKADDFLSIYKLAL